MAKHPPKFDHDGNQEPEEPVVTLRDRCGPGVSIPCESGDFVVSVVLWHRGRIWHRQVPHLNPVAAFAQLQRSEPRRRHQALPRPLLTMLRHGELSRRNDAVGMFDLWYWPLHREHPVTTFGAAFVTIDDIDSRGVWPDDEEAEL